MGAGGLRGLGSSSYRFFTEPDREPDFHSGSLVFKGLGDESVGTRRSADASGQGDAHGSEPAFPPPHGQAGVA